MFWWWSCAFLCSLTMLLSPDHLVFVSWAKSIISNIKIEVIITSIMSNPTISASLYHSQQYWNVKEKLRNHYIYISFLQGNSSNKNPVQSMVGLIWTSSLHVITIFTTTQNLLIISWDVCFTLLFFRTYSNLRIQKTIQIQLRV